VLTLNTVENVTHFNLINVNAATQNSHYINIYVNLLVYALMVGSLTVTMNARGAHHTALIVTILKNALNANHHMH
jgi:hypothetical protein